MGIARAVADRRILPPAAALLLLFLAAGCLPRPAVLPDPAGEAVDLTPYPWVYLRNGQPLDPAEPVVSLIAVGDIFLGRGVAAVERPLAGSANWLAAADLTLGNLEGVIVAGGEPRRGAPGGPEPIILSSPPAAVDELAGAGFDLLGLANNHSLDFGPAGLAETAARLQAAGMTPLGAGPDPAAAAAPHFREIRGTRLAFFAFNAVVEPDPPAANPSAGWQRADWSPGALTAVADARRRADAVVVFLHWGREYAAAADPSQERLAAELFAAGADLVLGHHSHVAQPLAAVPGHLAASSLGNFAFDQGAPGTGEGLALRAFFDRAGLRAVQALPVRAGPRPRLLSPAEGAPLLARIAPPPPRLAFTCERDRCHPAANVGTPAGSGRFWSGALDLTGDGIPERVRRAGGRVTIFEGEQAAWESPPEWEVVDAALGDPNDDGRGEILLALWQPDPDGHRRSQPYIVGHRGGDYKLLWGGRPLVHPIDEVELGDIDGDGGQELVVIETAAEWQSIAVWRWQGWHFSLVWRSEPGRYRDLVLYQPPGRPAVITAAAGP